MSSTFKYITFISLWLFSSCLTDTIQPDTLNNYVEKVVVNGVVSTSSPISFQLTNSKPSDGANLPGLIKDAQVELIYETDVSSMTYNQTTERYESSIIPKEGDRVSIRIRAPGYPIANVLTGIPSSVNAQGSWVPDGGGLDSSGNPRDLLSVSITDPPAARNYYRVAFFYYDQTLARFIPMQFTVNDPSLAEYNSYKLNDGSILFSDELFNGKNKVISTTAPFGLVLGNPNEKYLVVLENLSEDYYRYMASLQRARDSRDANFSSAFNNAVVIYSNVQNGLGILGAAYTVRDTLF